VANKNITITLTREQLRMVVDGLYQSKKLYFKSARGDESIYEHGCKVKKLHDELLWKLQMGV